MVGLARWGALTTLNKNSDDITTKETFHTNKRKITGAQEGWQPFPLNM